MTSVDNREIPELAECALVTVNGRLYALDLDNSGGCESLTHGHDAPHADGSPGKPFHHHHAQRCADYPLQATLRPLEPIADRETDLREYKEAHPGGTELTGARRRKGRALR